jgi:hypothetical protein
MIRRAAEVVRWHLEAGWDPEYGGLLLTTLRGTSLRRIPTRRSGGSTQKRLRPVAGLPANKRIVVR